MLNLVLALLACSKPSDSEPLPVETGDGCTEVTWYADADGDGHGVATSSLVDCLESDVPGYTPDSFDDCDDTNPQVHPGLFEVCDGIDQDCDAEIDEDATGTVPWYADLDGDGFGDLGNVRDSCEQPPGFIADATDCDDYNVDVNPDGIESCNGLDDDCDGTIDDPDEIPHDPYYADKDLDGFGDPLDFVLACEQPEGLLTDATDCDDSDAAVFPGGEEICNGEDDDCDGTIDDPDAIPYTTYYVDADGDAYGDPATALDACEVVPGRVIVGEDCDDASDAIYPGAPEACNGVDDDCDGTLDDPELFLNWYLDGDADGYGVGAPVSSCSPVAGRAPAGGDCEDGDPAINPGALELCNLIDDDCDGTIDDPGEIYRDWYLDLDSDGYGDDATALSSCSTVPGRVTDGGDCEDGDPTINPGADDLAVCNGVDDDCDGTIDDGSVAWYLDADGDGYGDASVFVEDCVAPPGFVDNDLDCDDSDPLLIACGGDIDLTGVCAYGFNRTVYSAGAPELLIVGVYQPDRSGTIDVTVDRPGSDVVLLVSSYEPVHWNVTVTPTTNLREIILNGYNMHTYTAPKGPIITRKDGVGRYFEACGYALPVPIGSGCNTTNLIARAEAYVGAPMYAFGGCYEGYSFDLGYTP
jgi:hypothetical protein